MSIELKKRDGFWSVDVIHFGKLYRRNFVYKNNAKMYRDMLVGNFKRLKEEINRPSGLKEVTYISQNP